MARWLAPFAAITRYRSLTWPLARREVAGRYRGASAGLLWSLFSPLLTLAIYGLAFGHVMKSRWPEAAGEGTSFALILFAGILVHGFFAECLVRAPRLMLDNANYVKRVVFPLEILPWTTMLSALFHLAMNLLVLLAMMLAFGGTLTPGVLWLPLVLAPLLLLAVAIGWLFSSIGVYLRDIVQVVPVLATALFFLSSAIVPVDSLPARLRPLFEANPLTFYIDQTRRLVLWHQPVDWQGWAWQALIALVLFWLAYAWFQRTRRGFADVL